MPYTVLIAKTLADARLAVGDQGLDDVEPMGVGASCYSTPHRVIFSGAIELNDWTWEWLMRDVHLLSVREVEWLK